MNSPRPLYKYLHRKKDGVADLVTKANFLAYLNQEFLKLIPTPVNQHVQLGHIDGRRIHVIADSPAWAAKFRFMSAHLIHTLNKNIQYFQKVSEISIVTRPVPEKPFKESRRFIQRKLSVEAKNCLENMAESLDDGNLKHSLLRLANRYKAK